MDENPTLYQAIQSGVNDGLRARGQTLNPVPGGVLCKARSRRSAEWNPGRGHPSSVGSAMERDSGSVSMRRASARSASAALATAQFRFQPGTWLEVATLLVEEQQNQFVRQIHRRPFSSGDTIRERSTAA